MDGKLRVAHLITQLELGGAQRNTLYTVAHLNPDRFQATLLCGPGGILDPEATTGAWSTTFIQSLVRPVRPWSDVAALVALYRELRRQRPHIVHTHSSKAGILGRVAAYLAGVPVIVHTFHGFGFTPGQSKPVRKLFSMLEWACARLSTHLIFVSEDNRQEATQLGILGCKPSSLIRSGISIRSHAPALIRQELGIPADAWLVVSVGNFKPQKNSMDLARTAAETLAQDPTMHFVLTGDGEQRAEVEAWVASQNLSNRIHFVGWRADARAIVAASDAFLLTSLWEGLPRAVVEAMMERKPVVAYGVNGVRDILQEGINGFMIPPGNTALAADKLLWLKSHPTDARLMGDAGRRRVDEEFNIDTMVRQQEVLYTALYEAVPLKTHYEPLWKRDEPA